MVTLKKFAPFFIMTIIMTVGLIGMALFTKSPTFEVMDLVYYLLSLIVIYPSVDYWLTKARQWVK